MVEHYKCPARKACRLPLVDSWIIGPDIRAILTARNTFVLAYIILIGMSFLLAPCVARWVGLAEHVNKRAQTRRPPKGVLNAAGAGPAEWNWHVNH